MSGLGEAVSSIFGGIGGLSESAAYSKAAKIASQNVGYTNESTKIQVAQNQREIYSVIGAQKAEVSGAGFTSSGTAAYLKRSSEAQGGLSSALTSIQGTITAAGFQAQAAAYQGQAAAAQAQGIGGILGGIVGIGAAIFSDRRMKTSIFKMRKHAAGINIYLFQYKGDPTWYEGVMADEVEKVVPEAVTVIDGFKAVFYDKIGAELRVV
jgi:hypothetical protein